jgi:signal transduction histidine kinase
MKKSIIFCVDDEKIVLNGLKSELKNSFGDRYIIETAENAMEALETIDDLLAANFEIPLIISDYSMPVIKGDELLTRIHEKNPQTLNILLTGQATVEGVTNAINNANLYRYIAKPWETKDLILTVEQALKSYNQQNQLELQNKQLRDLSASLEEKVEIRTLELRTMNEVLLEKQKEITLQNEELEKYRNHLEKLVKKRTWELTVAKEKAEESDRLKTAFMANISHEVRTPMNGILGFIDLLRSPEFEHHQQQQFLEIIENCVKQLMAIITDIVEISRLETNQVKPAITPCRIHTIRDNLFTIFYHNFNENSNLEFKISYTEQELTCLSDEIKIQQVLTNLISNAIRNTSAGTIEVGCSITDNKELLFSVKDSGIGIAKEYHEIIFERFRQVDNTFSRNYGGNGLGLAISKAYVELLGGKIWVESTPGIGSTFFFTIPFVPLETEPLTVQNNIGKLAVNREGATILIAEDVETNFKFLEITLLKENIKILRARNGAEAVEICKTNKTIDLVLMDIKMPELNGLEATKQILEFRSDLPIIAQTAYAFTNDRIRALESGCVDYISKPIKINSLLKMIDKHLNRTYN